MDSPYGLPLCTVSQRTDQSTCMMPAVSRVRDHPQGKEVRGRSNGRAGRVSVAAKHGSWVREADAHSAASERTARAGDQGKGP